MRRQSDFICSTCKQSVTYFGGVWRHARAVRAKACGQIPKPVARPPKSS